MFLGVSKVWRKAEALYYLGVLEVFIDSLVLIFLITYNPLSWQNMSKTYEVWKVEILYTARIEYHSEPWPMWIYDYLRDIVMPNIFHIFNKDYMQKYGSVFSLV